jgi:hypothetical protein
MGVMRQPPVAIRRYALARPGVAQGRAAERVRRLRLVRMEEIADLDRDRDRTRGRRER